MINMQSGSMQSFFFVPNLESKLPRIRVVILDCPIVPSNGLAMSKILHVHYQESTHETVS